MLEHCFKQRHTVLSADVSQHYQCVSLQASQFRAFHRRVLERCTEPIMRQNQQVPRKRPRILVGQYGTHIKRALGALFGELYIPRAAGLGDVSV